MVSQNGAYAAGPLFSLEGKSVLLTGASGFLGRTMVRALLDNGAEVPTPRWQGWLNAALPRARIPRGYGACGTHHHVHRADWPLIPANGCLPLQFSIILWR